MQKLVLVAALSSLAGCVLRPLSVAPSLTTPTAPIVAPATSQAPSGMSQRDKTVIGFFVLAVLVGGVAVTYELAVSQSH